MERCKHSHHIQLAEPRVTDVTELEGDTCGYQRQYQMSQVLHIELGQCRLHTAQLCLVLCSPGLGLGPYESNPFHKRSS